MLQLKGNVLITGGTGSLGRALVRRAAAQHWDCRITVFSRSEALQADMRARYSGVRYVIGDVRDASAVSAAIAGHDIVVHAAAMKRIPEAESQPLECYKTNVLGTQNVIDACQAHGVLRCVGISTDKAVEAITVYGATKLTNEQQFRSAPHRYTSYHIVRYGNVVSSRGSVIPIWREQQARRQPITVTDPDMTRFWLSLEDAVDLVLLATTTPNRTVLVPRLRALSIRELAETICPGAELQTIGLRSIERYHERLLHPDEPVEDFDAEHHLVVGSGWRGRSLVSSEVPRLTREQFLSMLRVAEEAER